MSGMWLVCYSWSVSFLASSWSRNGRLPKFNDLFLVHRYIWHADPISSFYTKLLTDRQTDKCQMFITCLAEVINRNELFSIMLSVRMTQYKFYTYTHHNKTIYKVAFSTPNRRNLIYQTMPRPYFFTHIVIPEPISLWLLLAQLLAFVQGTGNCMKVIRDRARFNVLPNTL